MTFKQWKLLLRLRLYLLLRKPLHRKMDFHTNFIDLTQAIESELVTARTLDPTRPFTAIGTNAGTTIRFLREVNMRFSRDLNVADLLPDLKTTVCRQSDFFVSDDGYFIDNQKAIGDLKEQLNKYAKFIQSHKDDQSFSYNARNVRHLESTTQQLYELTESLVSYLAH